MNKRLLAIHALLISGAISGAADTHVLAKRRLYDGTHRFDVVTDAQYAELAARVRGENKALPTALDSLKHKWRSENKIERKRNDRQKGRGGGKKHEVSKPFKFDAPRPQSLSREGPFRDMGAAERRKAELEAAAEKTRATTELFAARKLESMSKRSRETHEKAQEQQQEHMKRLLEEIDAILAGKEPAGNARRLGGGTLGSIDKTPSRLSSPSRLATDIKELQKPDPKLTLTRVKGKGKKK